MSHQSAVVFFVLGVALALGCDEAYPEEHTLCITEPASCTGSQVCGVSDAHKEEIVRLHNEYRLKIANGEESRGLPGPQPAGTNIKEMIWSDELAEAAERWAEQNIFKHDCYGTCKSDTGPCGAFCRTTSKYMQVGQNMFISWSSVLGTMENANWTKVVENWYDEVQYVNKDTLQQGDDIPEHQVGHYTQVVWSDTFEVGCGSYTTNENCLAIPNRVGKQPCRLFVCNYGPAGNGQYLVAYSSTEQCEAPSTKYPGLCAPQ